MPNKFKPLKARMRATFSADVAENRLGNVDRENLTLHDVQITLEGEAKGHGIFLDKEFCEAVAAAGNEMGDAGVKVRFGHPAMCSDALGTYLGRATNFRCVPVTRTSGEAATGVIADVKLDEHADRTNWVLDMAESAPDTFGQSIVFTYSDYVVKDADGVRHSYAEEVENEDPAQRLTSEDWMSQSADGRVYAVLGKLLGSDFTDTPAATDGVFSTGTLAEEAEEMLDAHPQILEVLENHPENVAEFLSRIGILDKLESKRVANLQAAKDKEIAALKAEINGAKDDLAKIEEVYKSELKVKYEELAAVKAEVERLNSCLEQANADLALSDKHLAEAKGRLAMLGHSVNQAPVEESLPTAAEIAKNAKLSAVERCKMIASGKFRK